MAEAWDVFNILNFFIDQRLRGIYEKYIEELIRWNQKINLTAINTPTDILIKHFFCSLSYLKAFTPGPDLRVLDIGTGAGFPGMPIKLYCPEIYLTLLEPSQKKLSFLKHIGRLFQLKNIRYLSLPVEHLNEDGSFDLALTRAFGPLSRLAKKAGTVLRPGGLLLVRKEHNYLSDLNAASSMLDQYDLKLDRIVLITSEIYSIRYYILAFRKCST
jgi:16S rRNA (guanine527-N7)-methyltransferase